MIRCGMAALLIERIASAQCAARATLGATRICCEPSTNGFTRTAVKPYTKRHRLRLVMPALVVGIHVVLTPRIKFAPMTYHVTGDLKKIICEETGRPANLLRAGAAAEQRAAGFQGGGP
jgi:hypothetical protein